MFTCTAKGHQERALQREEEYIPFSRVQGPDDDHQRRCEHQRLSSGGRGRESGNATACKNLNAAC